MPDTVVLTRGYSDIKNSCKKWKDELISTGLYKKEDIRICTFP